MTVSPEDQKCHKKVLFFKEMLGYIDHCIQIGLVVFVADFLQRLYYVFSEYMFKSQYYLPEDRLSIILRRSYSYNPKAVYFGLGLILGMLARSGRSDNFTFLLPNSSFLTLIPVYWIIVWSQLSHSPLSYAHWIRESHGLDYAAGMASNYFHGYLKLSLPEHNENGLQKRMQAYEDTHDVKFGMNRLIILIPDEMFVNSVIKSNLLQEAEPLETQFINRAGVYRPFRHAVYRLTKKINGTTYYFAMEGATPMLSFFEAMHFQLSATWQMQEMKREIWLKFCKHLKNLLNTWPETRREVELIIYNSHKANGDLVDVGDVLYGHISAFLANSQELN